MEQKSKYYDNIYRDSVKYALPYGLINYFPVWDKASEWVSPGDSVLDIGCGTGQFAKLLYDKYGYNISYTGVDFSGVAIKMARELSAYPFLWMDAFKCIKNTDKYRNKYIMIEFLEHIDEDIKFMSLIPAGKDIIFSVPNYESKAHVRTFKKQSDIVDRYGDLISISEVFKFNFTEARFITLVKAKRV